MNIKKGFDRDFIQFKEIIFERENHEKKYGVRAAITLFQR